MANQWAFLVGINQYTALQPLMYAQADAVALRNFFVDELGIPIDHCMLLTDLSVAVEPYAQAPSRQRVEAQLQTFCHTKVQPGDLLWVFFSGYGLAREGQDYWMPLEGDPENLAETAISVARVFEILQTAATEQIFLVLDMNRSQGAMGPDNIGEQTLALAEESGIATLMSCRPAQYSYETLALRHGLFTKALLEGLRYHGCVTVSQLSAYLSDRVPELSQHHWRPIQNPVSVIPPAQKFLMVVPVDGIARLPVTEKAALDLNQDLEQRLSQNYPPVPDQAPVSQTSYPSANQPDGQAPGTAPAAPKTGSRPVPAKPPIPFSAAASASEALDSGTSSSSSEPPQAPSSTAIVHVSNRGEANPGIPKLWQFGIAAAVVAFLAGVFVRYRPILLGRGNTEELPATSEAVVAPEETATANGEEAPSPDEEIPTADEPTAVEGVTNENTAAVPSVPVAPTETETEAVAAPAPDSAETTEASPADTTEIPTAAANADLDIGPGAEPLFPEGLTDAPGDSALQRAEVAFNAGRYGEAQTWLEQVPPESRNATYEALLQQTDNQLVGAAVRNKGTLSEARQILQPLPASILNDAIEAARQIPADDPYHQQAQQDIARWSRMIFDLAEGRAASGNFGGAIAAAELVPQDQPDVYQLAQQKVAVWQRQADDQRLIQEAESSLVPDQANSFQAAIEALQTIEADQPEYPTAQERINQWSQDILIIARARAAQGNLAGAIAAAELVPEETTAHNQAQQEIQSWRSQL